MSTLHMLVGIQGSGKSTYAKKLSKEFNAPIISSDIIRTLHPDWEEALIFPEVYRLCSDYLKQGIDVVADSTSITPKVRARYIETVASYGVEFKTAAYFINVPYEICYERVLKRNKNPEERYLPLEVIVSYASRLIPPTVEEGFSYVREVDQVKETLLKDLVVDERQGYAFYLKAGNSIIERYSGKKIWGGNDLIDRYTNFRLASVTKQFIARGIVDLVNDGVISYFTFLCDIYPDLPSCFREVKIINLLNHTSGIPNYEDMPHGEEQIQDEDILDFLMHVKELYFEPGEKYQYSNTAYVLLGLIIEKMSKINLGEYIKEHVFNKANMRNSFVNYQGITNVVNRAYGHSIKNNEVLLTDQYWCSATIGDGGLYSSVDDLVKWLDFIESDEATKVMLKPNILPNGTNSEYGMGIRIIKRDEDEIIYHCGETIGTNTVIGFIPKKNIKFIFLTNLNGINCAKFIKNLEYYLNK